MTIIQQLVYDLSLPSVSELLRSWGEAEYRATQIWQGLYQHYWNSPEEFSTLSINLRDKLANYFSFDAITPIKVLTSNNKQTTKLLFQLGDANQIEAVLMRYKKRRTICISTQSGCAMDCIFCATGQMGFKRNLTSGEIVAQVIYLARMLADEGDALTNIVIMGMGEPFHNYENTMKAIARLNDSEGFNFGARRFTISSIGLVPAILRFADENRQVNLAISLHAITDELRSSLLPINLKYPVYDLLAACRYYVQKTKRRITFEWALIKGINDTPEQARLLATKLKNLLCHVNVIPLNPTPGYDGQATTRESSMIFQEILLSAGVPCTIRVRRGVEIGVGCGQLVGLS
ncbi:MAG: 23S rRNA (adenine(2503)-C(2))-methyltransferase RlmN [Chloroflexota bacterium]